MSSLSHRDDPEASPPDDSEKVVSDAVEDSRPKTDEAKELPPIASWDGPDDPENALNWSLKRKVYHTIMAAWQILTVTYCSSVITPGIPDISRHFGVSTTAATLAFTVYVFGLAFGPVVSAPLSETRGRRGVYLISLPISLLFTMGAGFAKNFATLIICRLLAGLFGAACLSVSAGAAADALSPRSRGPASMIISFVGSCGPILGPTVGGYIVQAKGYRWTQWSVLFLGGLTMVYSLPQKESYEKIILIRRAKKRGLRPPPSTLPPGVSPLKFLFMVTLFRPMWMLVTEPITIFLSIYTAFNFGVTYGFFGAFPVVFMSPYPEVQAYHFTLGDGGLFFLPLVIGYVMAMVIFGAIDVKVYRKRVDERRARGETTPPPPEERLHAAVVGAVLIPIGLFWFAWSAKAGVHWIVPALSMIPFAAGSLMLLMSIFLYLVDAYGPLASASALAANGVLRYIVGGLFPLFTSQMYRSLGVGWATSLFGFVSLALLPIPWVLRRYGHRIRARSSYT